MDRSQIVLSLANQITCIFQCVLLFIVCDQVIGFRLDPSYWCRKPNYGILSRVYPINFSNEINKLLDNFVIATVM